MRYGYNWKTAHIYSGKWLTLENTITKKTYSFGIPENGKPQWLNHVKVMIHF